MILSFITCIVFIITKLAVLSCRILGYMVFLYQNSEILDAGMFSVHEVEAGMEMGAKECFGKE